MACGVAVGCIGGCVLTEFSLSPRDAFSPCGPGGVIRYHGVQQECLHVSQEDGRPAVGGHQKRGVVPRTGQTELGHTLPAETGYSRNGNSRSENSRNENSRKENSGNEKSRNENSRNENSRNENGRNGNSRPEIEKKNIAMDMARAKQERNVYNIETGHST